MNLAQSSQFTNMRFSPESDILPSIEVSMAYDEDFESSPSDSSSIADVKDEMDEDMIINDDNLNLRGGSIRKPRQGDSSGPDPDQEYVQTEDDWSEDDDDDNLNDVDDNASQASDTYSTNSDWTDYGNVPAVLGDYKPFVATIKGSKKWNKYQRKLHRLIYMRGIHPMLPSWWRFSFKMWAVTHPDLASIFAPENSRKRVAIHAYGNEHAAAQALEDLFEISRIASDYNITGYQDMIGRLVVNKIDDYRKWALRDAGLWKKKGIPPIILIQEYPTDFHIRKKQKRTATDTEDTGDDEGPAGDARRQAKFRVALARDIRKRLSHMGERWREVLWNEKTQSYIAEPPTLFGYAVVQHFVMLVSHDAGRPKKPVVILEQVRLNDRGQWLWNTLTIALPIHMARDALYKMRNIKEVVPKQTAVEDDPDL